MLDPDHRLTLGATGMFVAHIKFIEFIGKHPYFSEDGIKLKDLDIGTINEFMAIINEYKDSLQEINDALMDARKIKLEEMGKS